MNSGFPAFRTPRTRETRAPRPGAPQTRAATAQTCERTRVARTSYTHAHHAHVAGAHTCACPHASHPPAPPHRCAAHHAPLCAVSCNNLHVVQCVNLIKWHVNLIIMRIMPLTSHNTKPRQGRGGTRRRGTWRARERARQAVRVRGSGGRSKERTAREREGMRRRGRGARAQVWGTL